MSDKTQKVPGAYLQTGPVEAYQFTEAYKDRMFHWAWGNRYPDWEKDIPIIRIDHAMPTQIVRFTDWVVQYPTGQQAVLSDERFRESFREYSGMGTMTIPKTTCTWQLTEEITHSECGQSASYLNPVDYQMRYCPYCGRSIYVEPE